MEFAAGLTNPEIWEEYYRYCSGREHITRRELKLYRRLIDEQAYLAPLTRWLSEGDFPLPERKIINKMGSEKKRVVYVYDDASNLLLKVISWHLHRYEDIFPPNLFSFRVNSGVKKAVSYLTKFPRLRDCYVYKLDIHDYFNSVDVARILPMVRKVLADPVRADREDPHEPLRGGLRQSRRGACEGHHGGHSAFVFPRQSLSV